MYPHLKKKESGLKGIGTINSKLDLISGIFRVRKFWLKWRLEDVLNFHGVLFSLFQGLSLKTK